MKIDEITDINTLRNIAKYGMVQLAETVKTPTYTFNKGEWYFYYQDAEGYFLYEQDPTVGLSLTYDEANKILVWWNNLFAKDNNF